MRIFADDGAHAGKFDDQEKAIFHFPEEVRAKSNLIISDYWTVNK